MVTNLTLITTLGLDTVVFSILQNSNGLLKKVSDLARVTELVSGKV
jgi:hypothetical protein